jgi:hypothetical protein
MSESLKRLAAMVIFDNPNDVTPVTARCSSATATSRCSIGPIPVAVRTCGAWCEPSHGSTSSNFSTGYTTSSSRSVGSSWRPDCRRLSTTKSGPMRNEPEGRALISNRRKSMFHAEHAEQERRSMRISAATAITR